MSAMDIDVYDGDCEEEDISLKGGKYIHIQAMNEMDVMRYYTTENAFPI